MRRFQMERAAKSEYVIFKIYLTDHQGYVTFIKYDTEQPSRVSTLTLRQTGFRRFYVLLHDWADHVSCTDFAVDSYAIHFFCIGGKNY